MFWFYTISRSGSDWRGKASLQRLSRRTPSFSSSFFLCFLLVANLISPGSLCRYLVLTYTLTSTNPHPRKAGGLRRCSMSVWRGKKKKKARSDAEICRSMQIHSPQTINRSAHLVYRLKSTQAHVGVYVASLCSVTQNLPLLVSCCSSSHDYPLQITCSIMNGC